MDTERFTCLFAFLSLQIFFYSFPCALLVLGSLDLFLPVAERQKPWDQTAKAASVLSVSSSLFWKLFLMDLLTIILLLCKEDKEPANTNLFPQELCLRESENPHWETSGYGGG